mgnify:CR=1 FL=1
MAIKFLNNVDLGQNQLLNARIHVASSAPSGSGEGSLWLDSSNNTLKFYVADTGGGSAGFLSVLDDTNTNMSFTLTADSGSNQTISNGNTLDIAGGASITTSVGNTDTVTIDVTDNTIGAAELNVSGNGSTSQFLRSDGDGTFSWAVPTDTNTNTQNTTTLSFVDSTNDIIIRNTTGGAGSGTDDIKIVAGSNITLTHTDADNFTIASANDNTQLSTEQVQDIVGAMFTGNTETRIAATYEDGDGTIDLVVTDMTADTNTFRTVTAGGNPLGGSETLAFTAGSNVTITESGGAVSIASTDTNTTYSVGDGGLTQNNFTNTLKSKLDGITAAATPTNTANVKTALNASFGGSATIGDGSDTITIPGDLTVTGTTTTNNVEVVSTSNGVIFEGNAADANEGTLLAGTLSADRTYTLPNKSGTVAMTSDITGTNSNTNTGDQLVFKSVASDSGTAVADTTTDTLTIAGSGSVSTAVVGDTLTITGTDTNTQLSTEQVQDIVGAMFSSNTETRISATYEDGDGTIDLAVDDMTANDNTQNAYSTSVVSSSGIKLRLSGSGAAGNTTDDVKFAGSGATSVARTDASTITISSTDTNTVTTAGDGITLSGTAVSVTQFAGALAETTNGVTKSSNTYTITHGLGSGRVNVMITEVASPYAQVFPEIQFASAAGGTTCKVIFGQSVSDDSYNVTITK